MISAILRAQLLSMRLRVGTRRGGAIFSVVTGLIFYGFWAFLAWGAMLYFAAPANAPNFLPVLSSGLLFVMMYWQVAPVISAGFGASLDLRKLLIYPIPHGKLFTVEVLLRLTNCAEMLILVTGAAAGLLRNPLYGAKAGVFVVCGALIFAATNILLSAGARHLARAAVPANPPPGSHDIARGCSGGVAAVAYLLQCQKSGADPVCAGAASMAVGRDISHDGRPDFGAERTAVLRLSRNRLVVWPLAV